MQAPQGLGRALGFLLVAVCVLVACKFKSTGGAPDDKVFPALDLACTRDEDCATTELLPSCCQVCQPTYGSKAWVSRVETYCEAHPGVGCSPQQCSWMSAAPKCVEASCVPGAASR